MTEFLRFLDTGLTHASWIGIVAYTLVATHITIIAVTVYLHRHQAHRALSLHPIASHFFRLWLWLTTGMVTREWVAIHRKHHAFCEREGDPHSPRLVGLRTVLLRGTELYRTASRDKPAIDRYAAGCPDDWIERNLYSRWTWQGVGVLLILDVALFGVIGLSVWGIQMLWIPMPVAPRIRYRHTEVDDHTLRAVLANRARVMAALSQRLAPVWNRELRTMSLPAGISRRMALRLLARDPGYLNADEQSKLGMLLGASERLRHVQTMREQLAALWQRSLATEDQLREALSGWCARATRAMCPQLRSFARELRAYA